MCPAGWEKSTPSSMTAETIQSLGRSNSKQMGDTSPKAHIYLI